MLFFHRTNITNQKHQIYSEYADPSKTPKNRKIDSIFPLSTLHLPKQAHPHPSSLITLLTSLNDLFNIILQIRDKFELIGLNIPSRLCIGNIPINSRDQLHKVTLAIGWAVLSLVALVQIARAPVMKEDGRLEDLFLLVVVGDYIV